MRIVVRGLLLVTVTLIGAWGGQGWRPAHAQTRPCGLIDASTLLSYGVDGTVGTAHLQIIPDGARWFFRLTPPNGGSGAIPQYSGHLRVEHRTSNELVLAAQNPMNALTDGVHVQPTTLTLQVRLDAVRNIITGLAVIQGARHAIHIAVADALGLATLSCAVPLIRQHHWAMLYQDMAPEYRRRYSRANLIAALGAQVRVLTVAQPPNWSVSRESATPAAQFWGGNDLVAQFLTVQDGEHHATVALYAVCIGSTWRLVLAPPLACTLVTSKNGPFTCAISLATSDALGSFHLKVDGYGTVDGGLISGQFAVISATLPWQLDPGTHSVELSSDTGGSYAPTVGTAPITIPGAPTVPCPAPTAAPPPPSVGAALRIPGAFPNQAVWVTVNTKPITTTWDGFEIDVDGQPNGNDPGSVFSPVGIQVPFQAAPGWHTVSIYRMVRPAPGEPWVRGPLYAEAPFLVYAPGHCVLPANTTPPR